MRKCYDCGKSLSGPTISVAGNPYCQNCSAKMTFYDESIRTPLTRTQKKITITLTFIDEECDKIEKLHKIAKQKNPALRHKNIYIEGLKKLTFVDNLEWT